MSYSHGIDSVLGNATDAMNAAATDITDHLHDALSDLASDIEDATTTVENARDALESITEEDEAYEMGEKIAEALGFLCEAISDLEDLS